MFYTILFKSVVLGLVICVYCSGQDSGTNWLDSNQMLTIELPRFRDFDKLARQTDFFTNSRWDEFWAGVSHEEFGFVSKIQLDEFAKLEESILQDLQPDNVVVSVPLSTPIQWLCIIKSAASDPEKQMMRVANEWARIRNLEINSNNKSITKISDSKTEPVDWKIVDGVQIRLIENVYFFSANGWLVIASRSQDAEQICQRIMGVATEYQKLIDSRKYRTLSHSIGKSKRGDSRHVEIHLDPGIVWLLSGWFDEKEQKAWGLNEILAAGIAINLVPSQTRRDRVETVVDGFVLPSIPRIGISNAIRLTGRPKTLPLMPENIAGFFYANMDFAYLDVEKRRLFEKANGDGSYVKYRNGRSRMAETIGDELRKRNLAVLGNTIGTCWFEDENNTINSLTFRDVRDVEEQISVIEKMTEKGQMVSPNYGFVRDSIGGNHAMLSNQKVREQRYGMVFIDNWVIQADEGTLLDRSKVGVGTTFPDKVESLSKRLLSYSTIKDDRSILIAMFPSGWQLIRESFMAQMLTGKISQKIIESVGADVNRIREELDKIPENWDDIEFDEPGSKKECLEIARMTLVRIIMESFGQFVLIGNDDEAGFRFAAMAIPADAMDE